jgi:hypothetical protein
MKTTETTELAPAATVGLSVLVMADMRNALGAMATDESRSIGSMTRILLAEALERRDPDGDRQ